MASEKQYAYYIEGNQICIVERDLTFDNNIESKEFGPGVARRMWKSPITAVTDGLELKYTYSPEWSVQPYSDWGTNLYLLNAWTVVDGYLTFLRGGLEPATDIASANEYILIKGSDRWNGIHKVQEVQAMVSTTHAGIKTYTKVNQDIKYATESLSFVATEVMTSISPATTNTFSSGDVVWIAGSDTQLNNGLYILPTFTAGAANLDFSSTSDSSYIYVEQTYHQEETVLTSAVHTADTATIYFYEAFRDIGMRVYTDVSVLQDESNEIDLPSYLTKALVYYIKARLAEDAANLELKEYFMREYKKILERHESGKIGGVRIIGPGSHAIR